MRLELDHIVGERLARAARQCLNEAELKGYREWKVSQHPAGRRWKLEKRPYGKRADASED